MVRKNPQWLSNAVFYQIFPASYCDSNGDGIGDLCGIIGKLDYIADLGCNAIWINPCFVSPFADGGYDVADYYQIAPRYGTNDDMRTLFAEAAKRGIRVCLDLVPGHTSIEHEWFKESCKPETNKYSHRYIWTDTVWGKLDKNYEFVRGYSNRNGCYMTNFFYCQPSLNYGFVNPDPDRPWQLPVDHPECLAVREEIKNVMRFWLDMGASGFRVDMPSTLIKDDEDGWTAVSEYWSEVRHMLDTEYPDAVMISEWGYPPQAISKAGFHVDFMLNIHTLAYNSLFRFETDEFKFSDVTGSSYFRKEGAGDITTFLEDYTKWYKLTKEDGYIALISGNHDIPRISLGRDQEDLKVAFAFLLSMPGVPFIYYGDEIGMNYMPPVESKEGAFHRSGSRTPMQWSDELNAGFSNAPAESLYLPVDANDAAPNVNSQLADPHSLLENVRKLIQLRKSEPALGPNGSFKPLNTSPGEYPFIFLREDENTSFLVAVNPSRRRVEVNVDLSDIWEGSNELAAGNGSLVINGEVAVLQLNAVTYAIFKNEKKPIDRQTAHLSLASALV